MRALVTLLGLGLSVTDAAHAAAPNRAEKLAAIATVVKTWREVPKNTPTEQQLSKVVAVLVFEAAGAVDPQEPTAAEQKAAADVVSALKAQGADPGEAVEAVAARQRVAACAVAQSEAKKLLKALYVAEMSWSGEKDTFEKDFKVLEFEPRGAQYTVELVKVSATGFQARAVGRDEVAGDEWTIDESGVVPKQVKNACSK
jgi:hypothetical protein